MKTVNIIPILLLVYFFAAGLGEFAGWVSSMQRAGTQPAEQHGYTAGGRAAQHARGSIQPRQPAHLSLSRHISRQMQQAVLNGLTGKLLIKLKMMGLEEIEVGYRSSTSGQRE